MADLTITTANVAISDTDNAKLAIAGTAIAIGDLVYKSTTTGYYELVDINSLSTAPADPDGSEYALALSSTAASGQPFTIAKDGTTVTFGSILTLNKTYYGSANAGKISDTAPTSGEFGVIVGQATVSTTIPLTFHGSGVATA